MGLDMYLYADKYVSQYDYSKDDSRQLNPQWVKLKESLGDDSKYVGEDVSGFTVHVPLMYWRKFNALHGFIVDNYGGGLDRCQDIYLHKEHIGSMLALLKTINDNRTADKLIDKLFPGREGFFFGHLERDQWFWQDVESTIKGFKKLLDSDFNYFIYKSSW